MSSFTMSFRTERWTDVYDVGEDIGSGHYALVKHCTERSSGRKYAAKIIRKAQPGEPDQGFSMRDIEREVSVLRLLHHENVVTLHQAYNNKREVVLILELVGGGELFGHLCRQEKLSEEDAVGFLKQILFGLQHMHENNIAHLDLKPENVLLLNPEEHRIKLIDLGLAQKIPKHKPTRIMAGTAEFVAPEIVNFDPIGLPTDMWAIGVITYIMLSGSSPFLGASKQETFNNIQELDFCFPDEHFSNTSPLAIDFIESLLVRDPRKRADVDECLVHPWITPIQQTQVSLRKYSVINIGNLKRYSAQRRWKRSYHLVCLVNRLAHVACVPRDSSQEKEAEKEVPTTVAESPISDEPEEILAASRCDQQASSGIDNVASS